MRNTPPPAASGSRPGPSSPFGAILKLLVLLAALGPSAAGPAQAMPQDTLRLADLQRAAVTLDPRTAQAELEAHASDLRIGNHKAGRLPQFQLLADAGYQSEVVVIPVNVPGVEVARPPKDRYQASLRADWLLWDGGISGARSDAERARLAASLASLDAELFGLRMEVNDVFFGALLLQEALGESDLLIEDLSARLAELRQRVLQGSALAGDTAVVRAELLRAGQQRDAISSERRAALEVLGRLTGRVISDRDAMVLPDLAPEMGSLPDQIADGTLRGEVPEAVRIHPQYRLFDARRAQLEREAAVVRAARIPQLAAFGELSYGSPGFEQFTRSFHDYWQVGVQLKWQPWNWNKRSREIEGLDTERDILTTEEAAFTERLLRALQTPLRTIEQVRSALVTDDQIIALREQAETQARAQFAERAISATAYTDARTDVQEARVGRLRHQAELARAQAEYLITLGVELQ